jgi:hypothetical protein
MASASWIQRFGAACAAVALAVALLSVPPSHAASHATTGGSPAQEIGSGGSALVVVGPSTTTRNAEITLVSLRLAVAHQVAEPSSTGFRFVPAGGEAPAVTRWRIAHGTSTSSP